ncbi:MAG: hypothetical protein GX825_00760 [Syntrophomonadaceae bacterium]|nr:hypothetical protein [Syntrophomonadaceae bacterium]
MNKSLQAGILLTLFLIGGIICFYQHQLADLRKEYQHLLSRLNYLEPSHPQLIIPEEDDSFTYSVRQVLEEGASIKWRTLENNDTWRRPLYIPLWNSKSWNCNRFSYVPNLIENNRHRVFIYEGGGSYWFDLAPTMGFTDDTSPVGIYFKNPEEVAIIALEARIKDVIKLDNQVQIVIEPMRKGYHIIALPGEEYVGCQSLVITPEGFELELPLGAYSKGSYQ